MTKEVKTKVKKEEFPITDIIEEYFVEDGAEKTRLIYMSGKKKIKEETK